MRIKPGGIILGAILIGTSLLGILSGEPFFRGYPSPIWAGWMLLAAGVAIPVPVWILAYQFGIN